MTDIRQMPLMQATSPDDLNRHTPLRDSLSLFQQYLQRQGKSAHTVKAFTADLHLLAGYTGEMTRLGDYTTEKLNAFLRWLEHERGVPCSRKSYARRVTTLKVFFKWLHSIGAIGHDPAKPVLQRSGPAPLATILSPAEVDSALAHVERLRRATKPDARPALLFRLLLETGIKKSETVRLKPDDIDRSDPAHPLLIIRHPGVKDVYRDRKIALQADFPAILDEYLAQYKPSDTLFNCTARNLEYVLEDVGKGAQIPVKLSFEMMRWTSAVRDYRAGVEPMAIRDRLGLSAVSWQETFAKVKRLTERQLQQELGSDSDAITPQQTASSEKSV